MSVFATRYIQKLNGGLARPILVEANDKNKYVVKLLNNRVSKKVLINDYVCSKLGLLLGLPIPDVEQIFIPRILIEIDESLIEMGVEEGPHFASLYYDSINFTGSNSIEIVDNKIELADILAFDLWVGNDDRCDNEGNLIIDSVHKKVWAIDFGNGLNGPDWIRDDLECYDLYVPDMNGSVYRCIKNIINGNNPFNNICDKIESINYNDIKDIIDEVPQEWGISLDEKQLICSFLDNRKHNVRSTLEGLKSEFVFWR